MQKDGPGGCLGAKAAFCRSGWNMDRKTWPMLLYRTLEAGRCLDLWGRMFVILPLIQLSQRIWNLNLNLLSLRKCEIIWKDLGVTHVLANVYSHELKKCWYGPSTASSSSSYNWGYDTQKLLLKLTGILQCADRSNKRIEIQTLSAKSVAWAALSWILIYNHTAKIFEDLEPNYYHYGCGWYRGSKLWWRPAVFPFALWAKTRLAVDSIRSTWQSSTR